LVNEIEWGMLVKNRMISLDKDFKEVLARGTMYQSPLFGMLVLEKDKKDLTRFGLIVSKKIDKRAVVRNRIRRVVLESVRLSLDKIKNGYLVVFLTKKKLIDLGMREVKREVCLGLKKAGLLNR